jgi:hypothetical protein
MGPDQPGTPVDPSKALQGPYGTVSSLKQRLRVPLHRSSSSFYPMLFRSLFIGDEWADLRLVPRKSGLDQGAREPNDREGLD